MKSRHEFFLELNQELGHDGAEKLYREYLLYYYSGLAMQGMVGKMSADEAARFAVTYANALIKELEKQV